MGSSHPVQVLHPEHTAKGLQYQRHLEGYKIDVIVPVSGVEGSKHPERFDFGDSETAFKNDVIMWRQKERFLTEHGW